VQAETCPDCGTRGEDWTDEQGRPDPQALVAEQTVCLGCRTTRRERRNVEADDADGVRIRLVPRPHRHT
jgi:hypothetical protein